MNNISISQAIGLMYDTIAIPIVKEVLWIPIEIIKVSIYCCCPRKSRKKLVKKQRIPAYIPTAEELVKISNQREAASNLREKVRSVFSGVDFEEEEKEKEKKTFTQQKKRVHSHSFHAGFTLKECEDKEEDPDVIAMKFVHSSSKSPHHSPATPPMTIPQSKVILSYDEDEDFFAVELSSREKQIKMLKEEPAYVNDRSLDDSHLQFEIF